MRLIKYLASQVAYLCLREAKLSRQLRSLGEREILRLLEAPLQRSELVAGIDRPRLTDLFRFSVHHPHLRLWLFFHYKIQAKHFGIRKNWGGKIQ